MPMRMLKIVGRAIAVGTVGTIMVMFKAISIVQQYDIASI
jgi:hypothetical protein